MQPFLPAYPSPRWREKPLPTQLATMDTTNQQAITNYQREVEAWQQDKTQYRQEQERMRNFIEHEIHHNTSSMGVGRKRICKISPKMRDNCLTLATGQ